MRHEVQCTVGVLYRGYRGTVDILLLAGYWGTVGVLILGERLITTESVEN